MQNMLFSGLPVLLTATTGATEASQDLFNSAWTTGNLFKIQGVVNFLGNIAVVVISAVGFGIVIFSILKNAMSGLYVVNPPFWDKVSEIKDDIAKGAGNAVAGIGGQGKASNVTKKLGGALTLILGYIPNIKALTDFDESDGDVPDKKQYFIKSIPLLVAQIFIGCLIFMGYPTKIAAWIGNGGMYAIDAVLNNVDPVETVQKISNKVMIYNLSTDGTQDPWEQAMNEATRKLLATVQTKYNDMAKQPTQTVALEIESKLMQSFDDESIKNILGAGEGYTISMSALTSEIVPQTSNSYSPVGPNQDVYVAQATNGAFSYRYYLNGTNLSSGSTKAGPNDWFILNITATPVAVTNVSNSSLIAFGGFDTSGVTVSSQTGSIKIPMKGITVGKSANDIKGTLGQTMVVDVCKVEGDHITVLHSYQASMQSAQVGQTVGTIPTLIFSQSQKDQLNQDLNSIGSGGYLRINLVGTWTKDVQSNIQGNNSTTTLRIQEIRLVSNAASASYALSTWTDVNETTTSGVESFTQKTLTQTAMNQ